MESQNQSIKTPQPVKKSKSYIGRGFCVFSVIMIVLVSLIFVGVFFEATTAPSFGLLNAFEIAGICAALVLMVLAIVDSNILLIAKIKAQKNGEQLSDRVTKIGKIFVIFCDVMLLIGASATISLIINSQEANELSVHSNSGNSATANNEDIYHDYIAESETRQILSYGDIIHSSCIKKTQESSFIYHEGFLSDEEVICHVSFSTPEKLDHLYIAELKLNYLLKDFTINEIYSSNDDYDVNFTQTDITIRDKTPHTAAPAIYLNLTISGTIINPETALLEFNNIYLDTGHHNIVYEQIGEAHTAQSVAVYDPNSVNNVITEFMDGFDSSIIAKVASQYGYEVIKGEWGQSDIYTFDGNNDVVLGLYKLVGGEYQKINQISFQNRIIHPEFNLFEGTITYNVTDEYGQCYRKAIDFDTLEQTTLDDCL